MGNSSQTTVKIKHNSSIKSKGYKGKQILSGINDANDEVNYDSHDSSTIAAENSALRSIEFVL